MKNYLLALFLAIGFDIINALNLTIIGMIPEFFLSIVGLIIISFFANGGWNPLSYGLGNTLLFVGRLAELVPIIDLFPFFTLTVLIQWVLGW